MSYGRYEFHDDDVNSHKYWEIKPLGNGQAEVRWGRVGSQGQSQVVGEGEALKRAGEKLRKGYEMVDAYSSSKKSAPPTMTVKSVKAKKEPRKKRAAAEDYDLDAVLATL